MKTDSDLGRLTADWLKEGSRPLPTRVRDAVLSTVAETRQLSPAARHWTIRLRQAMAISVAALAVLAVIVFGPLVADGIRGLLPSPANTPVGASPSTDASPSVGASASPAPAGKIAFISDRDGNPEIYVMNADGSGQTNVSNGPGNDDFGAWSPDGSHIAFTSDRDGNSEVYVVNADGSGLTRLSNDPCTDGVLAWSPDGSRIAFASGGRPPFFGKGEATPPPAPTGCPSTIYVANADGSGLTNLTNGLGDDEFGAWSPDGTRIAFASGVNGNRDVYVVNADGSGLTNLTNSPGFDDLLATDRDGPTWSLDSSRVRFTSECRVVGREPDLYEVSADGSGLTNLGHQGPIFNGGVAGCAPSSLFASAADHRFLTVDYSPDFARIAFISEGDGNPELYVMNADFSGVTRLANGPAGHPVWSPDGSRIAFAFGRDVYVINADGSGLTNLTNLTNSPASDLFYFWFPDSSRIAFGSDRDGNGEIYAVNADGSGLTNLTNNPGQDYDPVWSPAR